MGKARIGQAIAIAITMALTWTASRPARGDAPRTSASSAVSSHQAGAARRPLGARRAEPRKQVHIAAADGAIAVTVRVAPPGTPPLVPVSSFDLELAGSNPTADLGRFRFTCGRTSSVSIAVYAISGRRVTTLADGRFEPGAYTLSWNLVDDAGQKLPAGMYFVRMVSGSFHRSRKLLIVR